MLQINTLASGETKITRDPLSWYLQFQEVEASEDPVQAARITGRAAGGIIIANSASLDETTVQDTAIELADTVPPLEGSVRKAFIDGATGTEDAYMQAVRVLAPMAIVTTEAQ